MEEDQNRLLLILLLPRFLPPKWSPDVECETILALWSARTARECIDDALRLGREAREVDRFGRSLRTIAGDRPSVNIECNTNRAISSSR